MKAHLKSVVARATKKCLALQRLKGVWPRQARQLYQLVITPATDDAVSMWFALGRIGTHGLVSALNSIQRLGARSVLGAFKGVSLQVLEAEAHLEPVEQRLHRRVTKHLTSLYMLQESNPASQCLKKFPRQGQTYPSPLYKTWELHQDDCLRSKHNIPRKLLFESTTYGKIVNI